MFCSCCDNRVKISGNQISVYRHFNREHLEALLKFHKGDTITIEIGIKVPEQFTEKFDSLITEVELWEES